MMHYAYLISVNKETHPLNLPKQNPSEGSPVLMTGIKGVLSQRGVRV